MARFVSVLGLLLLSLSSWSRLASASMKLKASAQEISAATGLLATLSPLLELVGFAFVIYALTKRVAFSILLAAIGAGLLFWFL